MKYAAAISITFLSIHAVMASPKSDTDGLNVVLPKSSDAESPVAGHSSSSSSASSPRSATTRTRVSWFDLPKIASGKTASYVNPPSAALEFTFEEPEALPYTQHAILPKDHKSCKPITSADSFSTAVLGTKGSESIMDLVFCRNATPYLRDLTFAKILSAAQDPVAVLVALRARSRSLCAPYNKSCIAKTFQNCTLQMREVVDNDDANVWPCSGEHQCTGPEVKQKLVDDFLQIPECKLVMEPQIDAFAELIAGIVQKPELASSAKKVRDAIKYVLNRSTPVFDYLSTLVSSEADDIPAGNHLRALFESADMIVKGLEQNPKVYSDALEVYERDYESKSKLDTAQANSDLSSRLKDKVETQIKKHSPKQANKTKN